MPGRRSRQERSEVVMLRLTPAELAAWRAHVGKAGGYLSALIRDAVAEHLGFTGPRERCFHY